MDNLIEKKLLLVGESGVGKTTFIKRHLIGEEFVQRHVCTVGCDVYQLSFNNIRYNVYDIAGKSDFIGLPDGYFVNSDCAIIMIDNTKTYTHNKNNAIYWRRDIVRITDNIPILLVMNKADEISEYSENTKMTQYRLRGIAEKCNAFDYCTISAKSKYNFESPFNKMTNKLN
jgi:GTP-binding nuclear protein Ran